MASEGMVGDVPPFASFRLLMVRWTSLVCRECPRPGTFGRCIIETEGCLAYSRQPARCQGAWFSGVRAVQRVPPCPSGRAA